MLAFLSNGGATGARSAGFDHYFVKPVDLAALVAVIERAPA